jgi:hypothetical protein
MAVSALTAQLPAHAGALPDLFRRADVVAQHDDNTSHAHGKAHAKAHGDPSRADDQHALLARASDDDTRMFARRAALGPLTYGRRALPVNAAAAAPIGMRGTHLDVRG